MYTVQYSKYSRIYSALFIMCNSVNDKDYVILLFCLSTDKPLFSLVGDLLCSGIVPITLQSGEIKATFSYKEGKVVFSKCATLIITKYF